MLPKAYDVLNRLFESLVILKNKRPPLAETFHLYFVGTGKSPDDPEGYNIRSRIERHNLQDCVSEHPQRMPYLDVLNHLHAASGILILGSTEPHYSPSKVFQSVMSHRPVFALLHRDSSAVGILKQTGAGRVVPFSKETLPEARQLALELESFIFNGSYSEFDVGWKALERFSARESARTLARALDEALVRAQSSN